MIEKILIVDDDDNILNAYRRQLRKQFKLETVDNPEQALEMAQHEGPFAVVLSDFKMPGMDGIELLSRIKIISPDTVRMMLTGHADLKVAMQAVNEGYIFRFLTKPCKSDMLAFALEAAINQYRLIQQTYELIERKRVEEVLREARDKLEQEVLHRTKELVDANAKLQTEINERIQAEKALRESQSLLTQVIDNIPYLIAWKNLDTVFLGLNTNFLRMLQLENPENIVGKTIHEIGLEPDFAEFMHSSSIRVMDTGVPEYHVYELLNEYQIAKTMDIGLIPYHDAEGKLNGVICILEDITDKLLADEERIRQEKQYTFSLAADKILNELKMPLMNLQQSKSLLTGVSHDNPLYEYCSLVDKEIAKILLISEGLQTMQDS